MKMSNDEQHKAFRVWVESEFDKSGPQKHTLELMFRSWKAGQQQLLLNSKKQKHVLKVECEPDYWSNDHFYKGSKPHINRADIQQLKIGTKLYLKPFFELNDGAQQVMMQPIKTAPKNGKTILLGYKDSHGVWQTVRGQWFTKQQVEKNLENSDSLTKGWYETSAESEAVWPINPTHWMPLPLEPKK